MFLLKTIRVLTNLEINTKSNKVHDIPDIAVINPKWPTCFPAGILVNLALVYSYALVCVSRYICLYTLSILTVFFACSLNRVVESCWSPAGFSACLACSVHTRQAIQVRGRGTAWCRFSSADLAARKHTHAHNPVQPLGQICQLFPACEHKHTQHTIFLSHSLSALSLPPIHCTQAQSLLGELMVQVERVGGWLGRRGGEEVCIG